MVLDGRKSKGNRPDMELPPHSISAEEAVIAALLLDDCIARVADIVRPDDFFREQNGWIYEACLAVWRRGEEITIPTVAHELGKRIDSIGGEPYLVEIAGRYFTAVGVEAHARIVARDAYYRRLIQGASKVATVAWEGGGDEQEVFAKASSLILSLQPPKGKDDPQRMGWAKVFQEDKGVPVGVPAIDKYLRGIAPGKLITLAGPSGQGKSILAAQIAREYAAHAPVLIVSMEMSQKEYEERLVRQITGIVGQPTTAEQWDEIATAQSDIEVLPLTFWHKARATLEQVVAKATNLKSDGGLGLVVVDYLQLMGLPNTKETEATRLGMVTSGLKQLATDLDVTVLLLSQMNRGAAGEMRGRDAVTKECIITFNKYPVPFIESLKGAGAIEQDSDAVVFIAKHPNCLPGRHSSIYVAKNRSGESGESLMVEDFSTNSFRPITESQIYAIAKGDLTISKRLRIDQGYSTVEQYENQEAVS